MEELEVSLFQRLFTDPTTNLENLDDLVMCSNVNTAFFGWRQMGRANRALRLDVVTDGPGLGVAEQRGRYRVAAGILHRARSWYCSRAVVDSPKREERRKGPVHGRKPDSQAVSHPGVQTVGYYNCKAGRRLHGDLALAS